MERWRQIEEIFHAALASEADRRAALVEEACGGDVEMQREIVALLSVEEKTSNLLDLALWDNRSPRPLTAGTQFGCYRIEALLGQGGMGAVYRARDTKLGRQVAFKVLACGVAGDPDYLRRFEDEARLASCLNHPNIVTIYGVGEEGGFSYIAMELVDGRTLQEYMGGGPVPTRKALELAAQLAEALAFAHGCGIVHRDLKPANIMVTPEDRIKVLDFGLAMRHQMIPGAHGAEDLETQTFLTGAGVILGTVGYMSPEQAAGGKATHTADQFSFGAILYEMFAGRRAFQQPTAVETLSAIIRERPTPIQSLNAEVTEPLREVLDRCLAKNPAERYPVTSELAGKVRELRDGWDFHVTAALPARAPAQPFTRRRMVRWGGLAAVAALSAVTAFKLWPGGSGIRSLAVLPFENAAKDSDAEFLCDGLTDSLIRRIAGLPSLQVRPRNAVLPFKDKRVDPQRAGRQLMVDAIVSGSVTRRAGKLSIRADLVDVKNGAVLWSARYDRDESDLLRLQDEIAGAIVNDGIRLKLSPADRSRLTRHSTDDREANELYMRAISHHDRETEEDYLIARKLLLQAIDRDNKFALAFAALAGNYTIMAVDGYAKPTESWPLVRTYAQQALALDPALSEAHLELGSEAFWNQWNWRLAEREFQMGSPTPESANIMAYVMERWAMGEAGDALRMIRRTRAIDPVSVGWRLKEADMLHQSGQEESAAAVYDGIINDEPDDARAYFGLAEVRGAQKRFDDAIASLRQAYQVMREDDSALLQQLLTARGEAGYRAIQKLEARNELDSLSARAAANHYVSPLDYARAYARLGSKSEVFEYLDSAFADRDPGLVFLKVDHAWDAVRDDPRFAAAVKRVGLP